MKLSRSGCFGSCPSYEVSVSTQEVVFDGNYYVAATGKHTATVDSDEVRRLAKKFISADFYSMEEQYQASVTDMPGYTLSIDIDGHPKSVSDYVGPWVGMPSVIRELEEDVDDLAQAKRWVQGSEGLVAALRAEEFNFQTSEAQTILKAAAHNGYSGTVRELLTAGVPLTALPIPVRKNAFDSPVMEHAGWLTAGANQPDVLQLLLDARASEHDQADKDAALAVAARTGKLAGVRALIVYGANPNGNPKRAAGRHSNESDTEVHPSVLMEAAGSGNPEVLSEILLAHPKLEQRDGQGRTAMFYAVDSRSSDMDGARVECVRLLARVGAKVDAQDEDGNTPLHETFLTDVEEELLKLGADVNSRNKEGETPIFTTVDDEAIPVFIKHGADLTIRNKKGQTVFEAATSHGPGRIEALNKAAAQQRHENGR